jgi:GT2 family glycosyltransferase
MMGLGLVRALVRRRVVLSPIRFVDLEEQARPGTWRSTGPLPKIELGASGARFPAGWVMLSLEVTVLAADSAFGEVRPDSGEGFAAAAPVRVPRTLDGKCFVRLPDFVRGLQYQPIKGAGCFALGAISAQEVGWIEVLVRQLLGYCRAERLTPVTALRAAVVHARVHGIKALWTWIREYAGGEQRDQYYGPWAARQELRLLQASNELRARADALAYRPKFSILMPVYRTPERWLRKAIESVFGQLYGDWELCICDDNSERPSIEAILNEYLRKDARIRIVRRKSNGHIAVATNDALRLASGEFICLMDHDDVLSPDALLEFALALNEDRNVDLIYSDEDFISIDDVRYAPMLKPAWSPENLESQMYVGHFVCCRADIARQIGGFRPEVAGAQDFDFVLRYTERASNVRHVPKILYHWRAVPGSTAVAIDRKPYVVDAQKRALEDRLGREGARGIVKGRGIAGWFETRRELIGEPKVSLIVCPGDAHQGPSERDIDACRESLKGSSYRNVEVLVAKHEGNAAEALNEAARQASGKYLVFLSAGVRVISPNWLEELLMYSERAGVGITGPKLLFADDTIRHCGIVFTNGVPRAVRLGYPRYDWGYWGSSAIARNYLSVSGACMMVRAETFRQVGGFDPSMAPTHHHFDLCLRVGRSGERVVYVPSAEMYDLSGNAPVDDGKSELAFQERWRAMTSPDPYYGANLTMDPPTFDFEGRADCR